MAAGLGFKDFTTGEVLTAADVDGYLMQGVWVFASAAARDAAVTSPQEGNFAYLKDTNTTTYYTGSAWTNLDTTGMVNPMTTTGDTIYSSSGSTPARLGIGSTGQVLTVAGGVPSWATPSGNTITNARSFVGTDQSTTSTSYTDLATSQSVTLTTGTKVLVLFNMALYSSAVNQSAMASIAVSGATTTSASDDWAIKLRNDGTDVSQDWRIGVSTLLTCTAGSNTFTLKFKSTSGSATANFYNRELIVIDLGS